MTESVTSLSTVGLVPWVWYLMQGTSLMGTVDNTFDKMDVAVALHHRLIDQTEFATLLCCLECQEDRDNVWHRILASKAHKQPVCPTPS